MPLPSERFQAPPPMPVPGGDNREFMGGIFRRQWEREHTRPAIGPDQVRDAIEAMDGPQRARLAELLGLEPRNPFLYLPRPGYPSFRPDPTMPRGIAIMFDRDGREVGRVKFEPPDSARIGGIEGIIITEIS